jgi:hypothetical protein
VHTPRFIKSKSHEFVKASLWPEEN